jgi:energy-coupling factor transporter ATP-binding protein EcfA2
MKRSVRLGLAAILRSSRRGGGDLVEQYVVRMGLNEQDAVGSSGNFKFSISSLQVGGKQLQIPSTGVTAIVGGNNVGKSTLLRQILELISAHHFTPPPVPNPPLLEGLVVARAGTLGDLLAWLNEHASLADQGTSTGFVRKLSGGSAGSVMTSAMLRAQWEQGGNSPQLGNLGDALVLLNNARERLAFTNPVGRRDDIAKPATHPLHFLEDDKVLLEELDEALSYVFGNTVTLDRLSGNLSLRLGKTNAEAPRVDAVTKEYREELTALPLVSTQGDGLAGTLGLLLPTIAAAYPIVLIDEPEAFLHPPQALRLGRVLAEIATRHNNQLIVATHDKNFLMGLLSPRAETVETTVVRLQRPPGSTTTVSQVPADQIKAVWSKPSMRYGNVLDGLFHDAVVICEFDRDCLFYDAAMTEASSVTGTSNLMFASSHGLSGVKELANILRAASVPVVAALDLDVLSDKVMLRTITESVGGTWTDEIDRAYDVSTAEFRAPIRPRNNSRVLSAITTVLQEDPDGDFTEAVRRRVSDELVVESHWKNVKRYGMTAFRAERGVADRMIELLRGQGVALVPVGELEGFGPEIQVKKGPGWVPAALEAGVHRKPESEQFAKEISLAVAAAEGRQ